MNTTNFQEALSKLILSASGWRGIFAKSGEEEDGTTEIDIEHKAISALMAKAYVDFIKKQTTILKSLLELMLDLQVRPLLIL